MANTTIPSELIADGAITSAKLDTNIAVGGTLNVSGAFTSLGIDDNATSTAITIDSSENVLVGKSAANTSVVGVEARENGLLVATRDGGQPLLIDRLTDDGDLVLFRKDSTEVGSIGVLSNRLYAGTGDTGLFFSNTTNGIHPWNTTSNSARDAGIDLGESSRRFKDLYLSGGVVFNVAGGTGTSTSGTLDDYEEGTWTPGLNGSGYTFGTHTGTYVKVGRVCTVVGRLVVSGVGTNTSNMGSLTGFPFAALNTTNQFQTGVARETTTTGRMYIVQINVNTTIGGINSMDGVTSGSNEIFTTGEYSFSLTYIATS